MVPQENSRKRLFLTILTFAVLFKLCIFIFGVMRVPDSVFDADSQDYLVTAKTLSTQGAFGVQNAAGGFKYELYRTPGYPFFLAIFHNALGIPLIGIILLQVLLAILAGLITYRLAVEIDYRIGILSMAIALFDPPTAVYSLKIMTEALYIPLLFWFIYIFIRYLKSGRLRLSALSALVLVLATYVRPISYFLGIAVALFMVYANSPRNFKRAFMHAAIFLAIIHSLLGVWQIRNYLRVGTGRFCVVGDANFKVHGLVKNTQKSSNYFTQSVNYLGETGQDFVNLMTLPGSLKYYKSRAFAVLGKIIFYPWMCFWLIGFLAGCAKIKRNIYYQFLLWVMLYFVAVTVINISNAAGERFRIPMVCSIAVISAYGWSVIRDYLAGKRSRRMRVAQ